MHLLEDVRKRLFLPHAGLAATASRKDGEVLVEEVQVPLVRSPVLTPLSAGQVLPGEPLLVLRLHRGRTPRSCTPRRASLPSLLKKACTPSG